MRNESIFAKHSGHFVEWRNWKSNPNMFFPLHHDNSRLIVQHDVNYDYWGRKNPLRSHKKE